MKGNFQWLQDRERTLLEYARRAVYETLDDGGELALHLLLPKEFREGPPRPAMVCFHGGAWDRGSVVQFLPHALYYVERGAIGALAEYRHRDSHPGARPGQAYADARAAMRYLRRQATELHLDPARLVAIGAGAGANLAGALLLDPPEPKQECDWRPSAAVLLSAVFDVVKGGPGYDRCGSAAEARSLSLTRRITVGAPPLLVVHGNADRVVPFEEAGAFVAKMQRKKNPCRLVEFEGRDREFFNLNVDPISYEAVLGEIDTFLDEHGLLERRPGEPGPHLISWRETDY